MNGMKQCDNCKNAWTDEEVLDKWYCTKCKAKTGTPVSIKRQDLLDD